MAAGSRSATGPMPPPPGVPWRTLTRAASNDNVIYKPGGITLRPGADIAFQPVIRQINARCQHQRFLSDDTKPEILAPFDQAFPIRRLVTILPRLAEHFVT